MDRNEIQSYVNNFRKWISSSLRPGVGMRCSIYPALSGGAVVEFSFGQNQPNDDVQHAPSPSLNMALSKVSKGAFGGNLDGYVFAGTNVVLENGRIIFIKDGSREEWTEDAARKDIARVLVRPRVAART